MLDAYTKQGWLPITRRQNYSVTSDYQGLEVLCFDLSPLDEIFPELKNESTIRNEDNRYLVKTINSRKSMCTYTCELDMDDWKTSIYMKCKDDQELQSKTLESILNYIKPNGWTVQNAFIKNERMSIDLHGVTSYDILMHCQELFQVTYSFHVLDKVVYVINPKPTAVTDKNIYITPQLNLKQTLQTGESSDFITCLIPLGCKQENEDFLTIHSVNGNKGYIENHTYSDKNIYAVWKEESIKSAQVLKSEAEKKLKELAKPIISFEVTIDDLAEYDDRYKFLTISMYDIIHVLLDEKTEIIEHVIEMKRFPDTPDKNIITLSSKPQSIQSKIDKVTSIVGDDGETISSNILQQAKEDASNILKTWAEKGFVYLTENEIYIMDDPNKDVAKNIIRMNQGGIGFTKNGIHSDFDTAWTIDGKFNADHITAGEIKGIKITNGNNFTVDEDGNMKAANGVFSGSISSSSISGGTVRGTTINGGTINGSTINGSIINSESGKKRISIYNGHSRYYDEERYVGNIGANQYKFDKNVKGIELEVLEGGNFLAFAGYDSSDGDLNWRFVYARTAFSAYLANTLNLGCPLCTQGYEIVLDRNHKIHTVSYTNGGGISIVNGAEFSITNDDDYALFGASNNGLNAYRNLNMNNYAITNQSDERLKKNIVDANIDCLSVVESIELKSYDWQEDGRHANIGAIAQQIQDICPNLIIEDKNGILGINTSDLIYYLLGALQQLSEEVRTITKRERIIKANNRKNKKVNMDAAEILQKRKKIRTDPNKQVSRRSEENGSK